MSLRSSPRPHGPGRCPHLVRFAVLAAGGTLAALTAAGPALAAPPPNPAPAASSAAPGPAQGHPATAPAAGGGDSSSVTYYGRVIARTGLLLRDAPNRGAAVIRSEPYGAVVPIFCKTTGENVDGNDRWYLLTDGTWAWGAARYIENIGTPPRWC